MKNRSYTGVVLCIVFLFGTFLVTDARTPPPPPTIAETECALCVVLLNELESLGSESLNEKYAEAYLKNKVCPYLSQDLAYVCDLIVKELPNIMDLIDGHVIPGKICEVVDVCHSDPNPPPINGKPLPHYVVDLDLPPVERWEKILNETEYWNAFWRIAQTVDAILSKDVADTLYSLVDYVFDLLPDPYASEIKGISKVTGIPLGLTTILNLFYEIQGGLGCTAIVGQNSDGKVFFSRNQDLGWGMGFTKLLRNITIMVDFQKGGKTVYQGVTFAGYVGTPTGFVNGKWALSVNGRFYNHTMVVKLEQLLFEFLHGGTHIGTWTVRKAMDNGDDFEQAMKTLSDTYLAADCYFIIGGEKAGQGAVISRNLTMARNTWYLDPDSGKADGGWFLAQTNYDHWKLPPWYDDRRFYAIQAMKKYCGEANSDGLKPSNFTEKCIYQVLSTKPVFNIQSLYTAQGYPPTDYFKGYHRLCTGDCAE